MIQLLEQKLKISPVKAGLFFLLSTEKHLHSLTIWSALLYSKCIYILIIYIMARKATEFPAQWVQMSDFKWTKNMTKKDWWVCKTFIDWILADVEKRDREILELSNQLVEEHRSSMRELADLRDRKDFEIWSLKSKLSEVTALKLKAEWNNTVEKTVMIISLIANIVLLVLLFA